MTTHESDGGVIKGITKKEEKGSTFHNILSRYMHHLLHFTLKKMTRWIYFKLNFNRHTNSLTQAIILSITSGILEMYILVMLYFILLAITMLDVILVWSSLVNVHYL